MAGDVAGLFLKSLGTGLLTGAQLTEQQRAQAQAAAIKRQETLQRIASDVARQRETARYHDETINQRALDREARETSARESADIRRMMASVATLGLGIRAGTAEASARHATEMENIARERIAAQAEAARLRTEATQAEQQRRQFQGQLNVVERDLGVRDRNIASLIQSANQTTEALATLPPGESALRGAQIEKRNQIMQQLHILGTERNNLLSQRNQLRGIMEYYVPQEEIAFPALESEETARGKMVATGLERGLERPPARPRSAGGETTGPETPHAKRQRISYLRVLNDPNANPEERARAEVWFSREYAKTNFSEDPFGAYGSTLEYTQSQVADNDAARVLDAVNGAIRDRLSPEQAYAELSSFKEFVRLRASARAGRGHEDDKEVIDEVDRLLRSRR